MSSPAAPPSDDSHQHAYPLSPPSPSQRHSDPARHKAHSPPAHSPSQTALSSAPSTSASNTASPPWAAAAAVFTPPASVPMSAQTSQTSLSATQHSVPNPVHNLHVDASQMSSAQSADTSMTTEADGDSLGAKRKFVDDGEQSETPSKRAKLDEPQEPLSTHPDLGPLYRLCRQSCAPSRPHASQDLISLYGLNSIANSVARFNSKTGEKINRLRKSYEGKIKELPGRNKAVSNEGELWGLLQYPDEEWHVQRVAGKDISQGTPDDLLAKLDSAVRMEPGRLPGAEHDTWRNLISLEEASTKLETAHLDTKSAGNASPSNEPYTASPTDSSRPSRRGVKRRYDDESFEGYGEAFADDGRDGQSPDDPDDGAGGSVRRRKRRDTAGSPRYPSFSGTYASNTVSVGYGSR